MSLSTVYRWLTDGLARAGSEEAVVEADWLLEAATGWGPLERLTDGDRSVPPEARAKLSEWVQERQRRVPVQYLVGEAAFWGMRLVVTPAVLIPRPDTETVVREALDLIPRKDPSGESAPSRSPYGGGAGHSPAKRGSGGLWPPVVVDLCTGSGAIALAIKKERPEFRVIATDVSEEALAVARANSERLGLAVEWVRHDLWEGLPVDWAQTLVVSNPPYLPTEKLSRVQPELRHEPALALDGGPDGLDFYRRLARCPAPDLVLEIDEEDGPRLTQLFEAHGWHIRRVVKDLGGLDRVLVASR